MKRFVQRTVAAIGLLVCVIVLLLIVIPKYEDDYLAAYNKKMHLLETISSPRIIFVGGSNLCFGLDSRRIIDSLGLPVINTGLHAGIGLKFLIDDMRPLLRKGDIVVYAPEYSHFFGSAYGEKATLAPLMDQTNWKKLSILNARQMWHVVLGIPDVIRSRLGYITTPQRKDIYRASNINEYGDEVAHWELPSKAIKPDKESHSNIDKEFGEYFINYLDGLSDSICIVMTPPVIRMTSFKFTERRASVLSDYLMEHHYPFNVAPVAHALPDSCAYDTSHHMNKSGVDLFTSLLIEELREIVETSSVRNE